MFLEFRKRRMGYLRACPLKQIKRQNSDSAAASGSGKKRQGCHPIPWSIFGWNRKLRSKGREGRTEESYSCKARLRSWERPERRVEMLEELKHSAVRPLATLRSRGLRHLRLRGGSDILRMIKMS